jgi:hypothetical protein
MDHILQELQAQFGEQAPAVQQLIGLIIQPLQQQINDLQQQVAQAPANAQGIADAIAQGIAQLQPPPVQPQQQREPKVADPPIFKGERNALDSFIRSVRTCFTLSPSRFPIGDEVRRILFTLGYIQGGTAGTWANNTTNAFLDPLIPNPYNTFEEFQNALERSFGSLDRAQKARTELDALHMKSGDSVEEFTTAFEALSVHTSYNEEALIQHYRKGLLHRIVEKIYGDSNGQLPATLEDWKTKARHIDYLYHEFKALNLRSQASVNRPTNFLPHTKPPVAAPSIPAVPAAAAEAMDVDGHRKRSLRCYNCQRFGHIARNCPQPKVNRSIRSADLEETVRSIMANMNKEEKPTQVEADFPLSQQ